MLSAYGRGPKASSATPKLLVSTFALGPSVSVKTAQASLERESLAHAATFIIRLHGMTLRT